MEALLCSLKPIASIDLNTRPRFDWKFVKPHRQKPWKLPEFVW